ncbi:MAG: B12-binding domain-containing radical SAM protein [Spirochaetales bacterium]|nr:B12-binding domain-containing radical SAM protein [Spirochaetales bacterium]
MKITFINPKVSQHTGSRSLNVPPKIKDLLENNPNLKKKIEFSKKTMSSLGLLTVAGCVPDDIEVEFFDENMEEIDYDQDFGMVAIGGNTGQMNRALTICDKLIRRNIPIVTGGSAVMTFPDQYIRRKIYTILGEGETLFRKFLDDYKKNQAIQVYDSSVGEEHVGLQSSPIPRYDLAAKYDYSMVGVQSSRGCPYNCSFCQVTKIYGPKYRHKSVNQVIDEIKIVKKYWPDSFFLFYDDNPFFDRQFAFELFDIIHAEKINLGRWGANANVTLYKDQELMSHLTATGPISFLGIGLESLSEESLETINNKMKVNHVAEYKKAIETFKANKINPVAYFMFGFENSKKADLDAIVDFCVENEIDGALTRVTPMPGSLLYEKLKENYLEQYGKIKKSSLAEWGVLRNYLNERIHIPENQMQEYLADAFAVIFSDEHFCHSDGPIPFYFLF